MDKFSLNQIVVHPIHGEGNIISFSTYGFYAIVRYPNGNGGFYHRTQSLRNLKGATL